MTDFRQAPPIVAMEPISLEEMDGVKLMNRIDTKFFTNEEMLLKVFEEAAAKGYRICEINGQKVMQYSSMYYDTPGLQMFKIHRAGHRVRQKIRVRTYLVSGITFLEVKQKNNKGRTKKKRMQVPYEYSRSIAGEGEAEQFIKENSRYMADEISPACVTAFNRITLVNREKTERVTFDTALSFSNPRTGLRKDMPDSVIIELKQDGRVLSEMSRILNGLRIHPLKISKYCIGTVLTDPCLLPKRFKEKVRRMEKIANHKLA